MYNKMLESVPNCKIQFYLEKPHIFQVITNLGIGFAKLGIYKTVKWSGISNLGSGTPSRGSH